MSKIQKKTLNLRAGDWDYIESIYGAKGIPTSHIVRKIVSRFVDNLRSQETPTTPESPNIDLEI